MEFMEGLLNGVLCDLEIMEPLFVGVLNALEFMEGLINGVLDDLEFVATTNNIVTFHGIHGRFRGQQSHAIKFVESELAFM